LGLSLPLRVEMVEGEDVGVNGYVDLRHAPVVVDCDELGCACVDEHPVAAESEAGVCKVLER